MDLEDFLKLGLNDNGNDVLEIYWSMPNRHSPHLEVNRVVYLKNGLIGHGFSLDPNLGGRGFLLCYYLRLVQDLPKEYRKENVEPPFIEVCPTKERNGVPNNNMVQIPLSYIQGVVQLGKKA